MLRIRPDHFERVRQDTHILYRCYNRKPRLLYVGMTNNPEERFKQHRVEKLWWKYVDHITLEKFGSRRELAEAEAVAINEEQPKFNVVIPCADKPPSVKSNKRVRHLWPEASNFGNVVPEYGYLIEQTIEQQMYPCVECHARAIYSDGDSVACDLCATEWTFDDWFAITFGKGGNTP